MKQELQTQKDAGLDFAALKMYQKGKKGIAISYLKNATDAVFYGCGLGLRAKTVIYIKI